MNELAVLDKQVFKQSIQEMIYLFPTWKMNFTQHEVVAAFYKYLIPCDSVTFQSAITEYIKTSTNNPTVAGINEKIKEQIKLKNYEEMRLLRLMPIEYEEV